MKSSTRQTSEQWFRETCGLARMFVKRAVGGGKTVLVSYVLTRRCHPCVGSTTNFLQMQLVQQGHTAVAVSNNNRSNLEPSTSAFNKSDDIRPSSGHNHTRITSDYSSSTDKVDMPRKGGSTSMEASSSVARSSRLGDGKRGLRHVVMEFLNQFMQGTKLLWKEIGLARKTLKRKKAGEPITFQEERILRQVPRDVVKALPLLVMFAVPIIGYVGPAVGFFFQKTLLPAQFWTSRQRLEFMVQDAINQEVFSFSGLLRSVAELHAPPRPNSTPRQLRASLRWFVNEGSLERLPRHHLRRLAEACNTMTPFKKAFARFMIKSTLVGWLRVEANAISDDDVALRRLLSDGSTLELAAGGVDGDEGNMCILIGKEVKLPPAEVAVLCWERGLLRSQHLPVGERNLTRRAMDGHFSKAEIMAMLQSLQDWLSLYDEAGTSSALTASQSSSECYHRERFRAIPPSMILHAPALLRLPHSLEGASPVSHLRVRPLEHTNGPL